MIPLDAGNWNTVLSFHFWLCFSISSSQKIAFRNSINYTVSTDPHNHIFCYQPSESIMLFSSPISDLLQGSEISCQFPKCLTLSSCHFYAIQILNTRTSRTSRIISQTVSLLRSRFRIICSRTGYGSLSRIMIPLFRQSSFVAAH